MIRKCFRFLSAPFRWLFQIGLGGTTPGEKLVRRSWLTVFLLIVVGVPLCWFVLFAQFHLIAPANKFNWVAIVNQEVEKIPEEDRAWPLYESGFEALSKTAYSKGFDPDSGLMFFSRNNDLRHHFTMTKEATQKENRRIASENTRAIRLFVEAANKQQLGHRLPQGLEKRLDREVNGRLFAEPLCGFVLDAAHETLRHAYLVAAVDGDSEQAIKLTKARLQIASHNRQSGPWRFCANGANECLQAMARDTCHVIIKQPDFFTDSHLEQLDQLFAEYHAFATDPSLGEALVENTLDQLYSESGYFTAHGVQMLQATSRFQSTSVGLTSRQRKLLRPGNMQSEVISFLALPAVAKLLPSREELRKELTAKLSESKELAERSAWQVEQDRVQDAMERMGRQPEWREVPGFLIEPWLQEYRPRTVQLYVEVTRLLIAMEQHRRATGVWPESLSGLPRHVPQDPYADGPIRYKQVDGVPILWSVGKDCQNNGGDSLTTRDWYRGYDWQLVPQPDPRLVELIEQPTKQVGKKAKGK